MRQGTFVFVVLSIVSGCGANTVDKGSPCDGCPSSSSSLAGTWEVIGSRVGNVQRSAVVTMSSGSLVVVGWSGTMQAVLRGNTFDVAFVNTASARGVEFSAARTDGPGDPGSIPLPLFGEWDAHAANTPGCTISARPDHASASCTRAGGLPDWMETGGVATLEATRTSALESQFGDFGGDWTFTTADGASCSIHVEGSTINANCTNAQNATGSGSLVFEGDSAHGSTSAGIEFTAQRR